MDVFEEKCNVSRVSRSSGAYRFRIEGYSGLSNRVGDSVESPEFQLCGHTWQLRIFPGGSLENHKGYVSYYLASKSTGIARASYKLIVVNQVVGGEDESFASSGIRIFEAKGVQVDGWGRDKFMLATMLKDSEFGYCVEDAVIFRVEITVYGDLEEVQKTPENFCHQPPHSLPLCLKQILTKGVACDAKIIIGDTAETIPVHRCILMARSDVFYAMFTSPFYETTSGEVFISDFNANTVKEMIHFIYADSFSDTQSITENYAELMKLAMKYQVQGMIDVCEKQFVNNLTITSAIDTLKLADTIGCESLKQKVMMYVGRNSSKILQSPEYLSLDGELLKELSSVIDSCNRKRGCRGSTNEERRLSFGCCMM